MLSNGKISKIKKYKQYHSSIKLFVASGGNTAIAYDLGIPKSTVASWKRNSFSNLVTHPLNGAPENDLLLFQQFVKDRFAQKLFSSYLHISKTFNAMLKTKSEIKNFRDTVLPVINNVKNSIGLDNVLKLFCVSRQRYDTWVKHTQCTSSPIGLCVKRYPQQLAFPEVNTLKKLFFETSNRNWPLASIYYYGLRKNLYSFSLFTFYKYVKRFKLRGVYKRFRKKCKNKGLKASKPNEYWHTDVTIFKTTNNTKVYIYFVMDNFSRYILSWNANLKLSAKTTWKTLKEAYGNSTLTNRNEQIKLVVDGGSENRPIPFDTKTYSIKKLIAKQNIKFSNSMIEAFNKEIKYRYLFKKKLFGFDDTIKYLEKAIPEFNNNRPYGTLKGLTPDEVYKQGFIPRHNICKDEAVRKKQKQSKFALCHLCKD